MRVRKSHIRSERYWLIITVPCRPALRLDVRFLDRILSDDNKLILAIEETTSVIVIDDDSDTARSLAALLAVYCRSATICRPEAYEDAKRRLELASRGRFDNGALALFVGSDDAFAYGDTFSIGQFKCYITDVAIYADANAELPVPTGSLDARLAMLVIAAKDRVEDIALLAERVAEYEKQLAGSPSREAGESDIGESDPG